MPPVDHLRAPAKLTRSLRVVGRREDGYHLLEAEMAAVDLQDELELSEGDGLEILDEVDWVGEPAAARSSAANRGAAEPTGMLTAPPGKENLVVKALAAAGRRARVRLTKHIPAGAGLGGGSSDAAAVLRWAGIADPGLAVGLGADVPFCVVGGRALARGTGEIVEPLDFEAFTAVLVAPALVVPTPEVYRVWDALGGPAGEHGNDLEPAALAVEPRLAWWRDLLGGIAGERPRLAGSGGTWYVERDAETAKGLVLQLQAAVRAARRRALVVAASSMPRL